MTTTMLPPPPAVLRTTARPAGPARTFRPEVEGLRAVAVLAVLLFHASVPGLGGGFVGVDIFFVISGFLITGQLAREAERSGTVRLGAFYARRAKRIIPPAAVVLTASAIGMYYLLPRLTTYRSSFDLAAALGYVANWRFIAQGKDYLEAGRDDSIVLHFWSLAVEEQFYLVWPLLVLVAAWLAVRAGIASRAAVAGVLTVATVASFGVNVWLTQVDPGQAYMATYTRAWQFGVGGLLALALSGQDARVRRPRGGRSALLLGSTGVAGAVLVGYSLVAIDESTPYPGVIALAPTLGAAALIAAGAASPTGWILTRGPMRAIGRISYSWYLWHWPVLILAAAQWGDVSWPLKLALTAGSGVLAVVTYLLVERPVTFLAGRPRELALSAVVGVVGTATALASIVAVAVVVDRDLSAPVTSVAAVQPAFRADAAGLDAVFGPDTGANSGSVVPAPLVAVEDVPRRGECIVDRTSVQPPCVLGVEGGTPVVLFGDSHAHQWQTALETIATNRSWELTEIAQSGCPVPAITPRTDSEDRFSQDFCVQWRQQQIARIVAMKPEIVFVSSFYDYIPEQPELRAGWQASIGELQQSGAQVVYIRDTPVPRTDIPECVSGALSDWSSCAFEQDDRPDAVETAIARSEITDVGIIDMNSFLCEDGTCPAVRNGTLLYRDDSHVSATAISRMTPAFEQQLAAAGLL